MIGFTKYASQILYQVTYIRRQYKVSVMYRLPTVPYLKKMPSKTVPFYSAGRDAILLLYAIRIEGGVKFEVDISSLFYRCCSSRLFLTWPFRSSLSIVSALLVD